MSATWARITTRHDGRYGFNWSYVHNDSQRASLLKTFHSLVPYDDRQWSGDDGCWIVEINRFSELKDFALTFESATWIHGDDETDLRTGQTFTQPSLFGEGTV